MKILVVGGGVREHAILRKLKENPTVTELYCAPGNGGIGYDATCVPIRATDIPAMVAFAVEKAIDLAVVAPDDPLVLGMVDALTAAGIACFGPTAAAARIEGSKVFSKALMQRYHIPTADYAVFCEADAAMDYITTQNRFPVVIKADGLALGKGVIICQTLEEAANAVQDMLLGGRFGKSGSTIVVEEFLTGPEVSVLAFTDGKTMVPMVSSMDHKRALDGDKGLNTGGMGTIAPNPFYTPDIAAQCMETIYLPTMAAMNAEGCPFCGCLYFGLMLTPSGPKVIEYNCRFGDPETQVVLPLLDTDLLTVMQAVAQRRLGEIAVEFSHQAAACVVLASGGYPGSYQTGKPIAGLQRGQFATSTIDKAKTVVYHAGTAIKDEQLVTAGGRVLGVTAVASTLAQAVQNAYRAADTLCFDGLQRRSDIGKSALAWIERTDKEWV
ncbi:MAG: phosphoribosylamine--glycine ligase [Angelakisella sp.]